MTTATFHATMFLVAQLLGAAAAETSAMDSDLATEGQVLPVTLHPEPDTGSATGSTTFDCDPRGPLSHVYFTTEGASLDLSLHVAAANGPILGEDDDSGGGTIPWLRLELTQPTKLRIEVRAEGIEEATSIDLRVWVVHESDQSLETEAEGRNQLERAEAALRAGDSGECIEILRDVAAQVLGGFDVSESTALNNLLCDLGFIADRAGAHALRNQAWMAVLPLRETVLPELHLIRQYARLNAALGHFAAGNFADATDLQARALAAYERILPADDWHLPAARAMYADSLSAQGRLAEAQAQQVLAVETLERIAPSDHPGLLHLRINLAGTLTQLGRLPEARELLQTVLATCEQPQHADSWLVQGARQNYALVLRKLGDLEGARQLQERNLKIRERLLDPDSDELLGTRQNYSITLRALGDVEGALAQDRIVLAARERLHDDDHPFVQEARQNLAVSLKLSGDLAGAAELEAGVRRVLEGSYPLDHPAVLRAKQNHAVTLKRLGRAPEALELEEQVLAARLRTLPPEHPDLQASRVNLIWSLAETGANSAILRKEIIALAEQMRRSHLVYLAQLSPRAAAALATGREWRWATLLSLLPRLARDDQLQVLGEAMEAVEAHRCAASQLHRLARCAPRDEGVGGRRITELRAEIGTINANLSRGTLGADELLGLQAQLAHKERLEEELVTLLSAAPGARALLSAPTVEQLAAALRPREAMVGYWQLRGPKVLAAQPSGAEPVVSDGTPERTYVAFVLRADRSLTFVDLGAAAPLDDQIRMWRDLAAQEGTELLGDLRREGTSLRGAVLDPVLAAAGEVERLYVALDGVLHLLPLDALPSGESGHHVGDDLELRVVTALRDLLLAAEEPPLAEPALLAAGAIDYASAAPRDPRPRFEATAPGADRGRALVFLEHTGAEVRAVAGAFEASFEEAPRPLLLTGKHATRKALVGVAGRARYLHLATHAWFAPDDITSLVDAAVEEGARPQHFLASLDDTVSGYAPMLLCGLALAGASCDDPTGRAAGILTAQEIAGLDLSGCELAVLSACETGLGQKRPGQGVASLQQALHAAGARLSLTSLWRVDDSATSVLMSEFYRRLWEGRERPHVALWEAKRTLRNATDARGRPRYTPRDWAGWVLCGVHQAGD